MTTLLKSSMESGFDMESLLSEVEKELGQRGLLLGPPSPLKSSQRRRQDNIAVCSVCGKSAIIVSLSRADRTQAATHAIQCQNRPAKDRPWRAGMCGHTEYIVLGDK